jgi:hypothetical protein
MHDADYDRTHLPPQHFHGVRSARSRERRKPKQPASVRIA